MKSVWTQSACRTAAWAISTGIVAGAMPGAALAQSAAPAAASPDASEIVVTARKREERLFDVPGAVSAVSNAQVEKLRLFDARDLLSLTPSAFLQENNAGTARDFSIRGVGTPTLFAEPGVATYVDEIYSSGFISYPTQFFDLERVEVLRGPQGALYGRNAVGGAVNVISKNPDDKWGASLQGTYGTFDRYELRGIVNAALTDGVGIRVSGWKFKQNKGEYFNPVTKRYLDANDTEGGRIVGKFDLTDKISLRIVAEHNEGETAGTYLFFPTAGETAKTVSRDTQPTNSFDTTRVSSELGIKTDLGTFTLISGGRNYTLDGVEDTDLSTDLFPTPTLSSLGKQISTRRNHVESRFAEARWLSPDWNGISLLVGATYLNDKATGTILTDLNGLSLAFSGGAAPFTLGIANNQSVKSWAGFAEATWKITDTVSLIGNLRYTSDDKSVDFLFTPSPTLIGFVGPSQAVKRTRTFNNWSPGATLSWSPSEAVRAYAKIQTGFRAGGYNFNVAKSANLDYDSETSVNYEVGARFKVAPVHAALGVSAYYLTQKNVLVPFFDFTAPPGLQGYLDNAGRARTFGLEVEASVQPVEGWTISGSLGVLDGKFNDGAVNGVSLKGKELPAARKLTTSLSTAYRRPITRSIDVLFNASWTHRSSGFQDVQNLFAIGGNNLINLSAGVDFGPFDLLGFVQNLGNDRYDIAFGGNRNGQSGVIRAQGRTYGVSARAKF
ncbi:TonB-dependent receptor [Novosphingobium sp.]|uniref:TonB-dependent receptor n=1 Tax=Novosphingobium sp. TaxID=1874826 RepID=UPI003BAD434F